MTFTVLPPMPGTVIRHRILEPLGIRQADLSRAMGLSTVRLNLIINGRAPITPETALRLAHVTGSLAEDWLGLQSDWDLHRARKRLAGELASLPKLATIEPRATKLRKSEYEP